VSEKETAAVVEFWKNQGTADYVEDFLEAPKDDRAAMEGASGESSDDDPLFDDAVRLVFEFGKAPRRCSSGACVSATAAPRISST